MEKVNSYVDNIFPAFDGNKRAVLTINSNKEGRLSHDRYNMRENAQRFDNKLEIDACWKIFNTCKYLCFRMVT